MENIENKLLKVESTLNNIRGIFDKNHVKDKLEEIEKIYSKKIFENKDIAKNS